VNDDVFAGFDDVDQLVDFLLENTSAIEGFLNRMVTESTKQAENRR
jgi:hypothetical protein